MSEEKTEVKETKNETDATISAEELKNIEKDVLNKETEKNKSIVEETEARVRAEMEKEQELKNLQAEKAKFEEAVKAQIAEKTRLEEAHKKEVEELKSKMGSTKAVIDNKSPFNKEEAENRGLTEEEINAKAGNLTDEQLNEIDKKSADAFFEEHGISKKHFFGG